MALEIIPLFATSLFVVLLLVFLLPLANPIIILFLGGFVFAKVIRKYRLDEALVSRMLGFFGSRSYFVLLGFMLLTMFFAFWMSSNTATTALMLAVIGAGALTLDADDPFKKALVLVVPFSASIGSIGTPVGIPPNAVAIGILAEHGVKVHFISWMVMAIPLAVIMLFITSGILYRMFPPKRKRMSVILRPEGKMGTRAKFVVAIALFTILLWLTSAWHGIPGSIVALLSVALFAIFGFLSHEDLNAIHWEILLLIWGGLALGQAMRVSGLGDWVANELCPTFPGPSIRLHWSFPDPPHDTAITEEVLNEFRKIRDLIHAKFKDAAIQGFPSEGSD